MWWDGMNERSCIRWETGPTKSCPRIPRYIQVFNPYDYPEILTPSTPPPHTHTLSPVISPLTHKHTPYASPNGQPQTPIPQGTSPLRKRLFQNIKCSQTKWDYGCPPTVDVTAYLTYQRTTGARAGRGGGGHAQKGEVAWRKHKPPIQKLQWKRTVSRGGRGGGGAEGAGRASAPPGKNPTFPPATPPAQISLQRWPGFPMIPELTEACARRTKSGSEIRNNPVSRPSPGCPLISPKPNTYPISLPEPVFCRAPRRYPASTITCT